MDLDLQIRIMALASTCVLYILEPCVLPCDGQGHPRLAVVGVWLCCHVVSLPRVLRGCAAMHVEQSR